MNTIFKLVRERLILIASLALSPVAPVFLCFSDPAKSIRFSLDIFFWPSTLLDSVSIINNV